VRALVIWDLKPYELDDHDIPGEAEQTMNTDYHKIAKPYYHGRPRKVERNKQTMIIFV
jgi:hypothetical protein